MEVLNLVWPSKTIQSEYNRMAPVNITEWQNSDYTKQIAVQVYFTATTFLDWLLINKKTFLVGAGWMGIRSSFLPCFQVVTGN